MADETNGQKCAHDSCVCMVGNDEKYCSEYCEEAHKTGITEIGCGCEHPGCAP
ncbi:MAG: hypothetical protein NVSMB56_13890 [Pyrinomonadaceae bacterium]